MKITIEAPYFWTVLNHIVKHKYLYIPFLGMIVLGLLLLALVPKGDEVLWLNQFHNPTLDAFFKYLTLLGEVSGGLLIGVVLLTFRPVKFVLIFLVAVLVSSLVTQTLKRTVFEDSKRPSAYFDQPHISPVDGVEWHKRFSFPSGHTTAAFCMFTVLGLAFNDKIKVVALLLAVLVGVSRIYLAQHFLRDVVAGSILGITIGSMIYYWLLPKLSSGVGEKRLIKV